MPPLENVVVKLLDASTVEAKRMRMAMSVVELVERISGLELLRLSNPACSNWDSRRGILLIPMAPCVSSSDR